VRLNTFTDYSLRVLLYVARAPEGRATIAEIARAYGISENHLIKVVHFLGKEELLVNTRGRGGGLRLARPPKEINIGKVVRLAEGSDLPAECFDADGNTCPLAGGCGLERMLGEAFNQFYATLERHTLADIGLRPRVERLLFAPIRT
jgi:Rrf2 family nitric oxide-sensitive transcriptional repressor